MDYVDLILVPFYIILIYFFFKSIRSKYTDPLLQKYHRRAFWVKIFACLIFIFYNVYISPGDSTILYQQEGNNLYHQILNNSDNLKYIFKNGKNFDLSLVKNPYNKGYFSSEANFMIIRIDALLSFLSFGSYAVINLFFASIAFSGLWKLFLFFYEQYPKIHRQFAFSILYFPTVVFWSSGLMKDTLSIAAVGWLTYAAYGLLHKKRAILKNLLILFISGYFLVVLKIYIILAYVPFLTLFLFLKNIQGIRFKLIKYLLAPISIALIIFSFAQIFSSYNDELKGYAMEDLTSSISNMNRTIEQNNGREDAASNFSLGEKFDGSFNGLIKIAPVAIATTLFRPFIWEAHKISQLIAAIESFALLLFTLFVVFKSGIIAFIRCILTDPIILFCFFFSIVFALFVGASTLNFGTLVRYKIPCLPFYAISLFLIYEKVKEKSIQKSLVKDNIVS